MGQPIILLIYCDELRADALSCNGGPDGLTPNIDRLAKEGLNFKRAYSASPVCVPCRWSGLTGQSVNQTGIWHNEAAWKGFEMSEAAPTVLDAFRASGWKSINVGKIHLPERRNPFDEHYPEGGEMGEISKPMVDWGREMLNTPKGAGNLGGVWPKGEPYPAEKVTRKVLESIGTEEGPLLIRASYLQPHTPVIPPFEDFEKWYDREYPKLNLLAEGPSRFERRQSENYGSESMDTEVALRCWWAYHALVHWVDRQVGALLEGVREMGRLGDLKIILTADHGASLGEGGAWAKQSFKDGSHRIPMIIWDGSSKGEERQDLSDSTDLARTLCDLGGVEPLESFGGRSLLSDPAPEAVVSGIGYGLSWSKLMPNRKYGTWEGERGWPRRACVRTPDWRYDRNVRFEGKDIPSDHPEADPCLIKTSSDPKEEQNVLDQPGHHAIAKELEARLQEWLKDAQEPISMPPAK